MSELEEINTRALLKKIGISRPVPVDTIDNALKTLSPREEGVLRNSLQGVRNVEIALIYHITETRLNQILNKAYRKLKHVSRLGKYVDTETTNQGTVQA